MKKMMLALAVVLGFMVAGQAAQVTWQQGSGAFTDASGNAVAGVALLFVAPVDADAPTLTYKDGKLTTTSGTYLGQTTLGSDGKVTKTAIALTGTWDSGTITTDGAYGFGSTVDAWGAGNSNKRDFFMVVFDSNTISDSSKYVVTSLTGKNAGTTTGNITVAFPGKQFAADAWTSVPEPCSVALVLLGVAALGLKRKIA
ncbi:MAG: PEP-CTERM sorting domain-containing protein [Kiritimatiellae bacterium]|nr:PEP-CTERM sorting domain-containing protein [Kiritimatiellia bacterium]